MVVILVYSALIGTVYSSLILIIWVMDIMAHTKEKQTTISISRKNHLVLTTIGRKGQSFDDILSEFLSKPEIQEAYEKKKEVAV
jgi:hypothetical protein